MTVWTPIKTMSRHQMELHEVFPTKNGTGNLHSDKLSPQQLTKGDGKVEQPIWNNLRFGKMNLAMEKWNCLSQNEEQKNIVSCILAASGIEQ